MPTFRTSRGRPLPLGPSATADGVNFALLCRHGTSVTLEILPESGVGPPVASIVLDHRKNKTGDHWHVLVSDLPDQWEALGVIDPIDTKATSLKGRGKRVTLKDKSGAVLADFIIGKEVAGQPNQRYVRVPDQKRTYAVNVNVDLSAKFSDWIETNLLKLTAADIRKVTFDNHKVDPERGTVTPGDVFTIERPTSTAPFVTDGLAPGQEIMTGSGMFGTVVAVDDDIITIESIPGSQTRWLRAAIAKVIEPPVDADEDDAAQDDAADDDVVDVPDDLSSLPPARGDEDPEKK